jgi:2-amino-4-hydroxy-6-hydroxymethyldihydropteridine diphosphokinase
MQRAFIGAGSNVGERAASLREALQQLSDPPTVKVQRVSSVYESDPVGPITDQPAFLNAVVELQTTLQPRALLQRCLKIEQRMGRQRLVPQGPRNVDLDLLLVADVIGSWPELQLPHAELDRRAFVLVPLLELEPDLVDPRTRKALRDRLPGVADQRLRRLGSLDEIGSRRCD